MKKSTEALFQAALFIWIVKQPVEKSPFNFAIKKGMKSFNNFLPKHFIKSRIGTGGKGKKDFTKDGYAYLDDLSLLTICGLSTLYVAIRKKLPRFDLDVKFNCAPYTLKIF